MPFEVSWLVDGQIIQANMTGNITIDDIRENSQVAISMFDHSDAPLVHVLVNEAELDSLPMSIKMFSQAAEFLRHPKVGWLIMYGTEDKLPRFMSAIITGMTKVRHRRFDTLEQALEFLLLVDTSLPSMEEIID